MVYTGNQDKVWSRHVTLRAEYYRKGFHMQVYQIRIKLYLLEEIPVERMQTSLASFIDKGFGSSERLLRFHEENRFKNYSYDFPYPIEKDKVYKKGKIYTVTVRTIDRELAEYFSEVCVNQYTEKMKGLTAEIRILPKKVIASLYTLTPVILKDEHGYWRKHMKPEVFEERLKINLIKKWNCIEEDRFSEDFQLYTLLEFLNDRPISMEYKNIKLLGDKLRLTIADNGTAQKLAYMALGTGLCEMNSRGAGFVNFRWL